MQNDSRKRMLNLLGIAQRGNRLVSGELAVEQAIRNGKAKLLLVAHDASDNTKKKYADMAKTHELQSYALFSKEELGECIGRVYRASVALSDEGLAEALVKLIEADKGI